MIHSSFEHLAQGLSVRHAHAFRAVVRANTRLSGTRTHARATPWARHTDGGVSAQPAILRRASAPRGAFTLVEAIAAITIISVLGVLTTFVLAETIDGYADASAREGLHLELSVALDQIARELRSIPLDQTSPEAAPDIGGVNASSIDFGSVGSLKLTGSDLVLARSGDSPATILTGVIALDIAAFDESNIALSLPRSGTACDPIHRLSISITAGQAGVFETLRTRVFIRSMISGAGT